jgi:hypothetical protein
MANEIFPRLLARGAEMLGGENELAYYLGAEARELQQWVDGEVNPPRRVFRRLSGLLARDYEPGAAHYRAHVQATSRGVSADH